MTNVYKMTEWSSHETHNIYPNLNPVSLNAVTLNDQQQFRLNKIKEIKDYFAAEIKERELIRKRLSKHRACFNYFDKSLILLSVTTGSISIALFAVFIWAPVGIASSSFSLAFSIFTWIVKKLFKKQEIKRQNTIKLFMLARSKLSSIESEISEPLIISEISHKDFVAIINEEKKYRELKESIRIMNSYRSDIEKIN